MNGQRQTGWQDGQKCRLSRELERSLFEQARLGDEYARSRIVEAYMPLAKSMASRAFKNTRTRNAAIELDDLVSSGYEGLLKAVDKFDPSSGNGFSSYARSWIQGALSNQLRLDRYWAPSIPEHVYHSANELRDKIEAYYADPDANEFDDWLKNNASKRLNKAVFGDRKVRPTEPSGRRIGFLITCLDSNLVSTSEPINDGDGCLGDALEDKSIQTPLESIQAGRLTSVVEQSLRELSEEDRTVIVLELIEEFSPEETCEVLGVSLELARRRQESGVSKLIESLRKYKGV